MIIIIITIITIPCWCAAPSLLPLLWWTQLAAATDYTLWEGVLKSCDMTPRYRTHNRQPACTSQQASHSGGAQGCFNAHAACAQRRIVCLQGLSVLFLKTCQGIAFNDFLTRCSIITMLLHMAEYFPTTGLYQSKTALLSSAIAVLS